MSTSLEQSSSPLYTADLSSCIFFFFNDTATTEIYTLSLHDALPIFDRDQQGCALGQVGRQPVQAVHQRERLGVLLEDRKSTRLNSSHLVISYAVFCLKKKNRRSRRAPLLATSPTRPVGSPLVPESRT